MLFTACQDIFKKPDFFNSTQSDSKSYKHKTDTQSIREKALINGYKICAVLCFHFDEDPPEERPIMKLNLKYEIELTSKGRRKICFSYRNCLSRFTVQWLDIVEEKGLSFIFNIPLPSRIDLNPT